MHSTRSILLVVAVGIACAAPLGGQGSLTGIVHDSAGRPISGVEVAIETLSRVSHTDETGRFVLSGLTPGMRLVRARRLGFTAFGQMVQIGSGENKLADIVLDRLAVKLDTVVARDQQLLREDPLLREFEENRKLGIGHFITRSQLAKEGELKMADLLERFSAIRIVRGSGGTAWVATARGYKTKNACHGDPPLEQQWAAPPLACNYCYAQVFLDNAWLSKTEFPNVNNFLPVQLEGVEYYTGGAETPLRYATLNSECGVVVFHTRRPP